jgi:CheY-like chemotaxis protein
LKLAENEGKWVKGSHLPREKEALLREPAPAPVLQTPAAVGKNRKLLVVDDNPVVLKAFEIKLKASGFCVITTESGATVARVAEQEKPELIISDINFPPTTDLHANSGLTWSGFSIMQWLSRFPELSKIPVILVTGAEIKQYQQQALAAGAVALFQKPVDYRQLLEVIVKTLGDVLPPAPGQSALT